MASSVVQLVRDQQPVSIDFPVYSAAVHRDIVYVGSTEGSIVTFKRVTNSASLRSGLWCTAGAVSAPRQLSVTRLHIVHRVCLHYRST